MSAVLCSFNASTATWSPFAFRVCTHALRMPHGMSTAERKSSVSNNNFLCFPCSIPFKLLQRIFITEEGPKKNWTSLWLRCLIKSLAGGTARRSDGPQTRCLRVCDRGAHCRLMPLPTVLNQCWDAHYRRVYSIRKTRYLLVAPTTTQRAMGVGNLLGEFQSSFKLLKADRIFFCRSLALVRISRKLVQLESAALLEEEERATKLLRWALSRACLPSKSQCVLTINLFLRPQCHSQH